MDELARSFRVQLLGDERLARLVTAGSHTAFSTLYKRYQRPLYRYCRAVLRSDADAHDAVQSTFARAFEALRRGQRDAPLRPWIYRIAHNESVSLIRARNAGDVLSGYLAPYVARPEDRASDREELGSLMEDLRELPKRPREATLLRELSGMSHAEIATTLGTSVNGAKQAIFEARTALTDFAAGRSMPCEDVREAISLADRRVFRGRRVSAHLRDCPACAQFVAETTGRRWRLRALHPPVSAGAAAALLSRLARAGSSVQPATGGRAWPGRSPRASVR
jgi:RNA polymerase sigma factor (sigma-70 family)